MEYRVLGPLEVLAAGGEKLALGGAMQQSVLASLLLRAGQTVALERLIDDLWDEPPETATRTVQVYVSRLRHELPEGAIESRRGGYMLVLDGAEFDLETFERGAEQGHAALAAGDYEQAAGYLREALALWRGPPLAGLTSEALRRETERLEEQRLQALEDRLEADLELGHHLEVVPELQALVSEHGFRERLRAQLMRALYRSGRQTEALEVYRDARQVLRDELGLEPSRSLRELQQAILQQAPSLTTDALPTGTVTLLFTDIEGSTRLLHEIGSERYGEALAEHRRVVREVSTRHGGVEVDAHGDGVFLAFTTAPDALAAAREITEALGSGPIRVRVGVHTGTPLLTDEGYVGVDVHRAARIAAVAHGGQVILSQSTAELVKDALRPLGEHQLRDLLEPVRLFQLGDEDFPPLASIETTNLPMQPTPFVGRQRELAEVLALLRDPRLRLLTLTGTGGSGKTRLALQAAAESAEDYRDGVFWVPLQALRDQELVEFAIAQAVGAKEDVALHLATRQALVLIDNFEHVIGAAEKLGDLCARLPALKLLVTSREPLHLGVEHEYPVYPLAESEATAFFSERARAVKPDFEEDTTVLEICQRLDCLPLALELAAVRVKALSAEDLLLRLERRLPLLTGGPRDAPERQRTLRATISWSYELLEFDEQRLFTDLAVFAGGHTLEAAERVCQADLDAIGALIDKSLLRRDGERYYMLETIREFASERLAESGEGDMLRRRHAEYYLELARSVEKQIPSPKAATLLDQLERDHDNLRAALAWLSETTPDRALRLAVWGLAGRLHSFGDVALDRRNTLEAARLYRESLEIGHQLMDARHTAYCLAGLAAVDADRGRRDVAARLWGCVRTFEEGSGVRLHETERIRYERLLGELEESPNRWPDFAQGKSMTLDEGVEYALANAELRHE
jgi:predicted ATPase/DNA-binding SARP family transcriptional activator